MKHFHIKLGMILVALLTTTVHAESDSAPTAAPAANQTYKQKAQYDWSNIGSFITTTSINGMQANKKSCGQTCESYDLSAPGDLKDGSFVFHILENNSATNHCKIDYEVPFIILEGYLVTRLHTYELNWESTNAEPCPNNRFVLKVDGDPTEPSGYKITLAMKEIKENRHGE